MGKRRVFEVYSHIYHSKTTDFSKIKKSLKLTSTRLSLILKKLESFGIITRNIIAASPRVVRYKITVKGSDLFSCIHEIVTK